MTLKEVTELYYSIYLYKTEGYDCFKYNFKLSSNFNSVLVSFFEKNKFQIQELSRNPKQVIILKSILSIFIYNKGRNVYVSTQKEFEIFVDTIQYYTNEFSLFINKFHEYNIESYRELYVLYTQKKIPFYIFYYILKYVRFKEPFSDKELIKNKFLEVHKMMEFFKHFDEDKIKQQLQEIQKIVTLNEMNGD